MDATLEKSVLIFVLFVIFVGLANYYQYRVAPRAPGRLRNRRRRRGPAPDRSNDEHPPDPEPTPGGLLGQWSIWASAGALLLCALALVLMWVAALGR